MSNVGRHERRVELSEARIPIPMVGADVEPNSQSYAGEHSQSWLMNAVAHAEARALRHSAHAESVILSYSARAE